MDYAKMNKDDVFAQVELYRDAKVGDIPEFTTKKDAVAWLTEQEKTLGTPHTVTQEDIDNNKDADVTLELGEVVILSPLSDAKVGDPITPEEVKEANEQVKDAAVTTTAPHEVQSIGRPQGAVVGVSTAPLQYYQGRVVISVVNKINNGKVYKQVTTHDSVALLSDAEFTQFVTPRS